MRELSLNVMDVVQNCITANASLIKVTISESTCKESLSIIIEDNGKGMSEEQVKSVIDPFFTTRTTRKVGLGIPLFKMQAEMTGGSLEVLSELGQGTTVCAKFITSHINMLPLGDINSTMLPLITGNEEIDFIYSRKYENDKGVKEFTLDTREIREVLDGVSFSTPDVVLWIKEFLNENTNELYI